MVIKAGEMIILSHRNPSCRQFEYLFVDVSKSLSRFKK